jgi:adenylate cyclase
LLYLFEDYALDSDRRELRRRGDQIAVEPQVFDLLRFLVENRDRVVSKDDLIASVWGGRIVSESTLDSRINAARRAIGDNGKDQRLIRTTIGKGVRFVGSMCEEKPAGRATVLAPPSQEGEGSKSRSLRRWRPVAAAASALILVLAAGIWWAQPPAPGVAPSQAAPTLANNPAKPAPRLSIVVLPFANLSGDPDQDYFVDAITDELTSDLSYIVNSFVIARTTAFAYKGKPVDIRQVGRDLGVKYALQGSVRRTGEQVQVNVQLIDSETGAQVWVDRFDTDRSNLNRAQDEITARLARALQLELMEVVARRIERDAPVNLDAQDLVMRGWAILYGPETTESLHKAEQVFEQALAADPGSVDARIGVASALGELLATGSSNDRPRDIAESDELLHEALDRDRNNPQGRAELGRLRRIQGRLIESQIELSQALSLDRNNVHAIIQIGITLLYLGKPDVALPYFEKFLQINPQWQNLYFSYFWLGECQLLSGKVDAAIKTLKEGRAANPDFPWTHYVLAAALGMNGEIDEAKAALAEFVKLKPELSSFSQLRAFQASRLEMQNPQYIALFEKTVYAGLRRAGLPDE